MQLIDTTVGRVLFNQVVPAEYGYINKLLTKKSLRDIIGDVLKKTGTAKTAKFLDDIKDMGYKMAFRGGLSFNLGDVIIPKEKAEIIAEANKQVEDIMDQFYNGWITGTERYNQVIDVWSSVNIQIKDILLKQLKADKQGFNSVYMMLDSGARGSDAQITQLSGMRGLMAKPTKAGAVGGEIVENPILSNFKEGLSVLEYFISTHGARKGLADTALKTADAGYLTRRLVDVAHDVIISEEDCGTLRGLTVSAFKQNDAVVASLYERILGRTSLHDIYNPQTNEVIVHAGDEINETLGKRIEEAGIEEVEIRSVLTCESKRGVCAKCYGRNLATSKMVQRGETVGVIAAQSIGEPGTQLTLRTFHVGGVAGASRTEADIKAKHNGILQIDELRAVDVEKEDASGKPVRCQRVIGRSAEMHIIDPETHIVLTTTNISYGSFLYKKSGDMVEKGDLIAEWDAFNALIISEVAGKVQYENIIEGVTYRAETEEQTGMTSKVIIETRQKTKNPSIRILDEADEVIKEYDLPVGARIEVKEGQKLKAGDILVKIPRVFGKAGDITGGLPRVTELFEARNPSDPATVAEIDGVVSFSKKLKRNNREVIITSRTGEEKRYLIPTSKQILAQENDFVRAGTPLSEGALTPADILAIKGPKQVQEYIVNEVQSVYRGQGVKIDDKHFEVIVRQMMRKVEIIDPGDTRFLEGELVNKLDFQEENDNIWDKKVVASSGDSAKYQEGQIISVRELRDENSLLKRQDKTEMTVRDAQPATAKQILQGITRASLQNKSFIAAASFQETTKVLTEAAVNARTDYLEGLKENVIIGHLIPGGTGLREYENIIVGSKSEYESLMASKEE